MNQRMTLLRTALASLIVISASVAEAKDMWPPPAKYDSGPLLNAQYPTPIISHLSPADLIVACHGKHLACSLVAADAPCRIFLPMTGWQKMVRHEMGHCRGWSADHKS